MSIFNTIDFSTMFKAKPTTTYGAWQGPVAPKSTGLAPEVLAEQQRLAQKYGIKTYDKSGNVTYDGSDLPKARSTNIQVPRTLDQFAKQQQRQDISTPQPLDTRQQQISQPKVQLLPQAQAQPISDLQSDFRDSQLERQGPPEQVQFSSLQSFAQQARPQSEQDVQQQQGPPSQLEENKRLAQLNLRKIRAEEKVEELKKRVQDLNDDMFNEAQHIKNISGNANINVENEAELLDLSHRYKALYTNRDLLVVQLSDAEQELARVSNLYDDAEVKEATKSSERVSISGIADFNPMEKGGVLSPAYIPARSPEERAIASGNTGTLIDPNFDLVDVSQSTLNLGIPTTETIPSGTGVDEIREIDQGMQDAADAAEGVGPERVLDDPVSSQLEGLRQSGDGLATFFGPQQQEQEVSQSEPTELELEEPREEVEAVEPTFEREAPRGLEGLSLTPEVQDRFEEAQQQAALDAELQEQQEQQEVEPQPTPIDEAGQSFSTQGQSILNAYKNFQEGADVFKVVDSQVETDGLTELKPSAVPELSKPDIQIPFRPGVSTEDLYLGAQEKLAEQGYLRGSQRLQVWDPDFVKQDGIKGAYVWKTVETEGFLGPTSFYPQQIKRVSKDGFGKYSDVGVSRDGSDVAGIPQRTFDFGGVKMTEGDVISNIYARQLRDRLENEKQKEYVAKLRTGQVSIRDALLEPNTRNQYFGKDAVLISDGVSDKRKEDITKFFNERGISLDERIGTIKLGPTKFTQKQIKAAANLDPKTDPLSKEIQKSFDRYPGNFPTKYVDRLVDDNLIGKPELIDNAEYFRKTEDGKPIFADKEPGQAEIQEAIFRKALYDISTGTPSDNNSLALSQQQDQALDAFIKELPPSRNYLITFTGDDGKLSNVIIDRNNIKLQLYNLYVNGRNPQNVTPFEGDIGAGSLSKDQLDDLRKLEVLSELNKRAESDEIAAAYKELVEKVGGDPTQVALTPREIAEIQASMKAQELQQGPVQQAPELQTQGIALPIGASYSILPLAYGASQAESFGFNLQQPFAGLPGVVATTPIVEPATPVATQGIVAPAPSLVGPDTPQPTPPQEITADPLQDPLAFLGQIGDQVVTGGAYPWTNIGSTVVGAGKGIAEGDVLKGINEAQMGETLLDRTIDAIGAGFDGFKARDYGDSDNPAIDALISTGEIAGGVYDQLTERVDEQGRVIPAQVGGIVGGPVGMIASPLLADQAGLGETRFSRAAGPEFAKLGQDILRNPVFYVASGLSEAAGFVLGPLAAGKAVKAAGKGAKLTAQSWAAISLASGGGGKGVRFGFKEAFKGKNPLIIASAIDKIDKAGFIPIPTATATRGASTAHNISKLYSFFKTPKEVGNTVASQVADMISLGSKGSKGSKIVQGTKAVDEVTVDFDKQLDDVGGLTDQDIGRSAIDQSAYLSKAGELRINLGNKLDDVALESKAFTPAELQSFKTNIGADIAQRQGRDPNFDAQQYYSTTLATQISNKLDSAINPEDLARYQFQVSEIPRLDSALGKVTTGEVYYRDPVSTVFKTFYERDVGVPLARGEQGPVNIPSGISVFGDLRSVLGDARPPSRPFTTGSEFYDQLDKSKVVQKELRDIPNPFGTVKREYRDKNNNLVTEFVDEPVSIEQAQIIIKFADDNNLDLNKVLTSVKQNTRKIIEKHPESFISGKEGFAGSYVVKTGKGHGKLGLDNVLPKPTQFKSLQKQVTDTAPEFDFESMSIIRPTAKRTAIVTTDELVSSFDEFVDESIGYNISTIPGIRVPLAEGVGDVKTFDLQHQLTVLRTKLLEAKTRFPELQGGAKNKSEQLEILKDARLTLGKIADNANIKGKEFDETTGKFVYKNQDLYEKFSTFENNLTNYIRTGATDPDDVLKIETKSTARLTTPVVYGAKEISDEQHIYDITDQVQGAIQVGRTGGVKKNQNIGMIMEYIEDVSKKSADGTIGSDTRTFIKITSNWGKGKSRTVKLDKMKEALENNDILQQIADKTAKMEIIVQGVKQSGRSNYDVVVKNDGLISKKIRNALGLAEGKKDDVNDVFRFRKLFGQTEFSNKVKEDSIYLAKDKDGLFIAETLDDPNILFTLKDQKARRTLHSILKRNKKFTKSKETKDEFNDKYLDSFEQLPIEKFKRGRFIGRPKGIGFSISADETKLLKELGIKINVQTAKKSKATFIKAKDYNKIYKQLTGKYNELSLKEKGIKIDTKKTLLEQEKTWANDYIADEKSIFVNKKGLRNFTELTGTFEESEQLQRYFVLANVAKSPAKLSREQLTTNVSRDVINLSDDKNINSVMIPREQDVNKYISYLKQRGFIQKVDPVTGNVIKNDDPGNFVLTKKGKTTLEESRYMKQNKVTTKELANIHTLTPERRKAVQTSLSNLNDRYGDKMEQLENFFTKNKLTNVDDYTQIRSTYNDFVTTFDKPWRKQMDKDHVQLVTNVLVDEIGRRKTANVGRWTRRGLEMYRGAVEAKNNLVKIRQLAKDGKKQRIQIYEYRGKGQYRKRVPVYKTFNLSVEQIDKKIKLADKNIEKGVISYRSGRQSDLSLKIRADPSHVNYLQSTVLDDMSSVNKLGKELQTVDNEIEEVEKIIVAADKAAGVYDNASLDKGKGFIFFSENGKPIATPNDIKDQMAYTMGKIKSDEMVVDEQLFDIVKRGTVGEGLSVEGEIIRKPSNFDKYMTVRTKDGNVTEATTKYENRLNNLYKELTTLNPYIHEADKQEKLLDMLDATRGRTDAKIRENELIQKELVKQGIDPNEKPPFTYLFNVSNKVDQIDEALKELGYTKQSKMTFVEEGNKAKVRELLVDREKFTDMGTKEIQFSSWEQMIKSKNDIFRYKPVDDKGAAIDFDQLVKSVKSEDIVARRHGNTLLGNMEDNYRLDKQGRIDLDATREFIKNEEVGSTNPFVVSDGVDKFGNKVRGFGVRDDAGEAEEFANIMDKTKKIKKPEALALNYLEILKSKEELKTISDIVDHRTVIAKDAKAVADENITAAGNLLDGIQKQYGDISIRAIDDDSILASRQAFTKTQKEINALNNERDVIEKATGIPKIKANLETAQKELDGLTKQKNDFINSGRPQSDIDRTTVLLKQKTRDVGKLENDLALAKNKDMGGGRTYQDVLFDITRKDEKRQYHLQQLSYSESSAGAIDEFSYLHTLKQAFVDSPEVDRAMKSREIIQTNTKERSKAGLAFKKAWDQAEAEYQVTSSGLNKFLGSYLTFVEKTPYMKKIAPQKIKSMIAEDSTIAGVDVDIVLKKLDGKSPYIPEASQAKYNKVMAALDADYSNNYHWKRVNELKDKLVIDKVKGGKETFTDKYGVTRTTTPAYQRWKVDRAFRDHEKSTSNDRVMIGKLDNLITELETKFNKYEPTGSQTNKFGVKKQTEIRNQFQFLKNQKTKYEQAVNEVELASERYGEADHLLNKELKIINNDLQMSAQMKKFAKSETNKFETARETVESQLDKYLVDRSNLLMKRMDIRRNIEGKTKKIAETNSKIDALSEMDEKGLKGLFGTMTTYRITINPASAKNPEKLATDISEILSASQRTGLKYKTDTLSAAMKGHTVQRLDDFEFSGSIKKFVEDFEIERTAKLNRRENPDIMYRNDLIEAQLKSKAKKSEGIVTQVTGDRPSEISGLAILRNPELTLRQRLGGLGLPVRRAIARARNEDVKLGPRGTKRSSFEEIVTKMNDGRVSIDDIKAFDVNDQEARALQNTFHDSTKVEELVRLASGKPKVAEVTRNKKYEQFATAMKLNKGDYNVQTVEQFISSTGEFTSLDKSFLTKYVNNYKNIKTLKNKLKDKKAEYKLPSWATSFFAENNNKSELTRQLKNIDIDINNIKDENLDLAKIIAQNPNSPQTEAKLLKNKEILAEKNKIKYNINQTIERFDKVNTPKIKKQIIDLQKIEKQIERAEVDNKFSILDYSDARATSKGKVISTNIKQTIFGKKSKKIVDYKKAVKSLERYDATVIKENNLTIQRNTVNNQLLSMSKDITNDPTKYSGLYKVKVNALKNKRVKLDEQIRKTQIDKKNYWNEMYVETVDAVRNKFKFPTNWERTLPPEIGTPGSGGIEASTGLTRDAYGRQLKGFTGDSVEELYRLPLTQRREKVSSFVNDVLSPQKPVKKIKFTDPDSKPDAFAEYMKPTQQVLEEPETKVSAKLARELAEQEKQVGEFGKFVEASKQARKVLNEKTLHDAKYKKKKRTIDYLLSGAGGAAPTIPAVAQDVAVIPEVYAETQIKPPFETVKSPFDVPTQRPQVQTPQNDFIKGLADSISIPPLPGPRPSPEAIKPIESVGIRSLPLSQTSLDARVIPAIKGKTETIPRLIPRLDITPKQIPRIKSDVNSKPIAKSLLITPFRTPQRPRQDTPLVRPRLPIIAPPPFWLGAAKKKRKRKKPKKKKKAKILWQVPDWWGGYYDPREYTVVKGNTTPKKFRTGNFGFDTE